MPCLRRSVKPTPTSRHWQPIFACLGGKGRNLLSESSLIYPTTLPHSRCTRPTKKYWNSGRKQASVTVVFFSNRVVPLIPGTQMTPVFCWAAQQTPKDFVKKRLLIQHTTCRQGTESVPSSLRVVRKPRFSESTWVFSESTWVGVVCCCGIILPMKLQVGRDNIESPMSSSRRIAEDVWRNSGEYPKVHHPLFRVSSFF